MKPFYKFNNYTKSQYATAFEIVWEGFDIDIDFHEDSFFWAWLWINSIARMKDIVLDMNGCLDADV